MGLSGKSEQLGPYKLTFCVDSFSLLQYYQTTLLLHGNWIKGMHLGIYDCVIYPMLPFWQIMYLKRLPS